MFGLVPESILKESCLKSVVQERERESKRERERGNVRQKTRAVASRRSTFLSSQAERLDGNSTATAVYTSGGPPSAGGGPGLTLAFGRAALAEGARASESAAC